MFVYATINQMTVACLYMVCARLHCSVLFILCRHIGSLLEESLTVLLAGVIKLASVANLITSRTVSKQLVEAFPIMAESHHGSSVVLINCHELLLSGDAINQLLSLDKTCAEGLRSKGTAPKITTVLSECAMTSFPFTIHF